MREKLFIMKQFLMFDFIQTWCWHRQCTFVSLANVYLSLTFSCPTGPNRSLKLNVTELWDQATAKIQPPLLLIMNGHSPKLISPSVTPMLSPYSLFLSECRLWWPPLNICPREKLGLDKDLGKVILSQATAQQKWHHHLGQVVIKQVQIGLAATLASGSCDINPTLAAVCRGHVFGAYQNSLCPGVISSADRKKVAYPEKQIHRTCGVCRRNLYLRSSGFLVLMCV